MGVVNYNFYSTVYMGTDADETSFPALCARASDVIGALTHWAVDETTISKLPALYQGFYKKAICAQIDFLAINGMDSLNETASAGFTVGKVTVHGKTSASGGGSMKDNISPLAIAYLDETGLMNPQVPTSEGWWL
jgi:hypothetical protein